MKLDPYLIPHTQINSKWIKDLNIRPETLKFLEENIGSKLLDISLGNDILDLTPKEKAKIKNKPLGLHQTKKHSKGSINIMKSSLWMEESIYKSYIC